MLTQQYLQSLFDYNPETGIFTRKFTKGAACKDKIANCINKQGYIVIVIDYKLYRANRLAWLYVYGYMPKECVDHCNGIRTDNRLSNLRLATIAQNNLNTKTKCTNTSGIKGISWNKNAKKWRVYITVDKKQIHLGFFNNFEQAKNIIYEARNKYHGEFANHE